MMAQMSCMCLLPAWGLMSVVPVVAHAKACAWCLQQGLVLTVQVRYVQPGTWAAVWRQQLDAGEQALSLHCASLRVCGEQGQLLPSTDTQPLVAVGTALSYGEDHPCTGRVLVFRVRPAPEGAPEGLSRPTGELAYSRCVPLPLPCCRLSRTLAPASGTSQVAVEEPGLRSVIQL